jgi:hypothetical protein
MGYYFIFNQICILLEKYNVNYTVEDSVIITNKKNIEIYVDCFCGISIKYKNKLHYFHSCDLKDCFIYIISKIEEKRE